MNLDHIEDDLLQRYFDGELSNRPLQQVKEHLDKCHVCQKRQQSLVQLHSLLAQNALNLAEQIDFNRLYGRISSEISRQKSATFSERLRAWWDSLQLWQPQVWAPVSALAVAGVLIAVVSISRHDKIASDRASGSPNTASSSEIIRVDFGGKPGTVFEVALAEGTRTAVVWINDDVEDLGIQ
jgi:anti-sigma factor RsiW